MGSSAHTKWHLTGGEKTARAASFLIGRRGRAMSVLPGAKQDGAQRTTALSYDSNYGSTTKDVEQGDFSASNKTPAWMVHGQWFQVYVW